MDAEEKERREEECRAEIALYLKYMQQLWELWKDERGMPEALAAPMEDGAEGIRNNIRELRELSRERTEEYGVPKEP